MPVIDDPQDDIRAILILYAKGFVGPSGVDATIMAILRTRGQATKRKIHPMKVGIHHLNRGGVIGASLEVVKLMDNICELSWNDDECSHALCVEIKKGDRFGEDEFRKWCEDASVDFPPVEAGSLEAVSLACSHTNCGLRAVVSKCSSSNEKLGDGTNYDVDTIRKRDRAFAEAAEGGLMWTVVLAVVLENYPELVELWSISRNTAGHVQRPVSEVTGMTLLHSLWTKAIQEGKSPCYKTIVMNVTRGRPWWASIVDHFVAFLARHSGDESGWLWKRFQTFHAHCIASDERQMPGYMWRELATILLTRCVYAILFAAYTCPEGILDAKQCVWIRITELRALKREDAVKTVRDAEDFLISLARVFESDGAFFVRVSAAAVVLPGPKVMRH